LRQTEGQIVWQRNYYEHIIRNEREMENIWKYIEANPVMWAEDDENPAKW
jgi:putative transposase